MKSAGALKLSSGELPELDVIHTANLFPGEPAIRDQTGIAAAVWVEKMKQHR
jgi:hypothetical protein